MGMSERVGVDGYEQEGRSVWVRVWGYADGFVWEGGYGWVWVREWVWMGMSVRVRVNEYNWGYVWMSMIDSIGVDGYA